MGMASEIAIERTVQVVAKKIKKELEVNVDNSSVCKTLKEIGRFTLKQFECSTPDWAKEYEELFKE